jgi:cytochrome c peroxidase
MIMLVNKLSVVIISTLVLQACGVSNETGTPDPAPPIAGTPPAAPPPPAPPPTPTLTPNALIDDDLRALIAVNGLTGDPSTGRDLPEITSPLAQLGKKLFFTKALGGDLDSACVSCHHPVLGGGDRLSLSVGVGALMPDLLGAGRRTATATPNVPRNAPTTFNIGLWDTALFMDSRVDSLGREVGQNGAASGISTPDSGINVIDGSAGANLVVAQARFPVTSAEEMRGQLEAGESNDVLRAHLAARLGNYGVGQGELQDNQWLTAFQTAFVSAESAENLVTFDNIIAAIAEYERSQVFTRTPWRDYVQGANDAISDDAKQGAILFYTAADEQGGGCVQCHSGDLFTDGEHHTIGAPQFGPGKGNPNNHDFGRENISGNATDRFRIRTPSLLNVEVTGPYMHTGAYESLQQVLGHYNNPNGTVDDFFDDGGWCELEQFAGVQNCAALYPNAEQNSDDVLAKVNRERNQDDPAALPNIDLANGERNDIVAFLQTLTDPCVESRACLAAWIPTAAEAADGQQLEAVDSNGDAF